MNIRVANTADAQRLAFLMRCLWPEDDAAELLEETQRMLADKNILLLLCEIDQQAIGFAQCSLRQDYVEGTSGSPVGYLEGIYVLPEYRRRGIARALVAQCRDWARERGCEEFASDCEEENVLSQAFHRGVGFHETNRIVCYISRL